MFLHDLGIALILIIFLIGVIFWAHICFKKLCYRKEEQNERTELV